MSEPTDHPREALSPYLDDALSVEERSAVDRHLAACEDCRIELAALSRLASALAEESIPGPPHDLAAKVRTRIDESDARKSRLRFALPATIAATLGAVGVLFALRWHDQGMTSPRTAGSRADLEAPAATSVPAPPVAEPKTTAASPSPAFPVPPAENPKAPEKRSSIERDEKNEPSPQDEAAHRGLTPEITRDALSENTPEAAPGMAFEAKPPGVAGAAVGGVAGASRQRSETVPAVPPTQALRPSPKESAKESAKDAASMRAVSAAPQVCGDRWIDSGLSANSLVKDPVAAAVQLDRLAHDFGGKGIWWGVADGRPYVLVVPRGTVPEVVRRLRSGEVKGLDQIPELPPGTECVGLSIVLAPAPEASPR